MGYPRKSYPHRCSPPCAKRSRPRACARVYIIYRSPVGRSRGVSTPLCPRVPHRRAQGGGGRRQRRTHPRAVPNHAACVPNHCAQRRKCTRQTPPLSVRSPRVSLPTAAPLPACVPNHCVQRRKYTRPTPPPPVRSLRVSLSTAALPPADGRSAERRVGEGEGKGGRPLAQQPASVCLPPRPRRLNGSPGSAGGRENDRMAHRRTTTPTHRTQRGNDTCTIRVP